MKHVKITAFDCPDAWFKALASIWAEGDDFQVGYGSEETDTKKLNFSEIPSREPPPCERQSSLRYEIHPVVCVDVFMVRRR